MFLPFSTSTHGSGLQTAWRSLSGRRKWDTTIGAVIESLLRKALEMPID
jgi:hypothetical protein